MMSMRQGGSRRALLTLAMSTFLGWGVLIAAPAARATECFIGEIRMFGGNFAPRNWALANGQLLRISDNAALFSILGTIYGGDGRTTFALPDLRGRTAVHPGSGAGLTTRTLGQRFGSEEVALTTPQMPKHRHRLRASSGPANSVTPTDRVLASPTDPIYDGGANTRMHKNAISISGKGEPHENVPPSLGINHIICLFGVYPSRN